MLRLVFILLGAALLGAFHITFYFVRAAAASTRPASSPATTTPRSSRSTTRPSGCIRKRVPMSEDYDGQKLFTRENGKRLATPLLAVFVVVATPT